MVGASATWHRIVQGIRGIGAIALVFAALLAMPTASSAQATPGATVTACAGGTPVATSLPGDGTGAATPSATPAPAGLATPVISNCLAVTLTTGNMDAGPQDLSVTIKDAAGQPVTDAGVTLRTRSLEMNHGVASYTATSSKPGVYVANDVPMGMGGKWQAEIFISRPGVGRTAVVFVFSLNGPGM